MKMSNPWTELLKKVDDRAVPRYKKVIIVCAPNVESSRQFEARFLPTGVQTLNETLNVLGFDATSLEVRTSNGRLEHFLDLDVYTIPFPVKGRSIECLRAFVKLEDHQNYDIHYFFLLDWSMSNQRTWLRQLNSSVQLLQDAGSDVSQGSITVCCMNTEHIYTWQKNTAQWLPRHVEFVQQSVRSFCLLKECSLLYCTSLANSEKEKTDQTVFVDIVSGDFSHIMADLVNPSKLLIPFGSDSIGLIKTVCDSFDPIRVLEEEFICEKFETFVPTLDDSSLRDEAPSNLDLLTPYKVDIQQELAKIYHKVQAQKAADSV